MASKTATSEKNLTDRFQMPGAVREARTVRLCSTSPVDLEMVTARRDEPPTHSTPYRLDYRLILIRAQIPRSANLSKRVLGCNAHREKCKRTPPAPAVISEVADFACSVHAGRLLTCFRVLVNSPRSCVRHDTSSIR